MKLFVCFGGAAAVIDDEVAEVAARRLQGQHRRCGRRSLSFRGKFLFGNNKGGNDKKPSAAPALDADDDGLYSVSRASSVASSALLSTASSLDSSDTSSSSLSSRSSTASSSPSVSGMLYPPPVKRQAKRQPAPFPAVGAAAVVLCLLMVVLCGRFGATLLTSTALYLFPRRWPATTMTARKAKRGAVDSLECDAALESEAEEEATAKRKVVVQGSSVRMRNRNK